MMREFEREGDGSSLIRNPNVEIVSEHNWDAILLAKRQHACFDSWIAGRAAGHDDEWHPHVSFLQHVDESWNLAFSCLEWPLEPLLPGVFDVLQRQRGTPGITVSGPVENQGHGLAHVVLSSFLFTETGENVVTELWWCWGWVILHPESREPLANVVLPLLRAASSAWGRQL